jgi:hypothetical protein
MLTFKNLILLLIFGHSANNMQLRYRHISCLDLYNNYVVELPDGKWGFAKFSVAVTMMGVSFNIEAELTRLINQAYQQSAHTLLFDGNVMLLNDPLKMYVTHPFDERVNIPMTELMTKSVDLQNNGSFNLSFPTKNADNTCICIGPRARDCKAHDQS